MTAIPEQVKLPIRVAFGVVLQGIRIRLGRSLITVAGVVLGIAFLMAIFTGQALRRGVSEEDRVRADVNRMYNFLTVEMGPPEGRTLAVILCGPTGEMERRLLQRLEKAGLGTLRVARLGQGDGLEGLFTRLVPQAGGLEGVAREASAVLVAGEGTPAGLRWDSVLVGARERIVAPAREYAGWLDPPGATVVRLARQPDEEEILRLRSEERRARARNIWLTVISLLVTVMGISNAMLMSVTERFREIGTMKCLGALSSFVRTLFLIEAALVGAVGGAAGVLAGLAFMLAGYAVSYGWGLTCRALQTQWGPLSADMAAAMAAALVLSAAAAVYPAYVAARMIPANALRSNV